jgi:pimeloyl-ACP methyl ester carboxylesterase
VSRLLIQIVTSSALVAAALFSHATPSMTALPFDLPAPTGASRVGTTRWTVVDRGRPDPFSTGSPREIEVVAWYPTRAETGARAPYVREGPQSVRSFATLLRAPGGLDDLIGMETHAFVDAPVDSRATLPLLLFSHGYTGVPDAHATILEELASHGYAVLSIVHPYEATAARLADGRVVSMLDDEGKLRPEIQKVFAEWRREDAVMSEVTKGTDRAEQRRLLKGYLDTLHETSNALKRWVDDTRAVVADLPRRSRRTIHGQLADRLDLSRFGVFGHSMGGVTAAEYCLGEPRCGAVLNLDGIPQYGSMFDRPLNRPLMMVYSARPGRAGASDPIYEQSARPYRRADVADTLHLDFSDMTLWPLIRQRGLTGPLAGERAVEAVRVLVREFFDQQLRHRPSPPR